MLTVPEAAKIIGRNPETIRRWIRSGRLRSSKVGTQHIVNEEDLITLTSKEQLPLPKEWQTLPSGTPAPNYVAVINEGRRGR